MIVVPRPAASSIYQAMKRIGKYEIVRKLGSGATSTVYLAQDLFNNQQVALKMFTPDSLRGSMQANAYHKLLLTEASLAGKLSHPHIMKIFDAVMDGELNYMVMEYVAGETLERHTEADQLLPIGTVAEIIYKCSNALAYAQQQGVIHRDIKPANILLCGQSDIKISDFGAALVETHQQSQQLTQVAGLGSPAYMSPEQIQDLPLTHQTDIYSLGVTMYKLLSGRLPFSADNSYSLLYLIMHNDPPPLTMLRPEVSLELGAIVQRAMQKDLSLRYPTWDEFARDLVSFFNHNVVTQAEIYDVEKFDILRALEFFRNFSDVELWEVLRLGAWRKVRKGEAILREGAHGREFFILGHGVVKVLKQGRLLSTLYKGDCFGEMAHLSERDFMRTTDVAAESDVTLMEINPDVLERATAGCRFQIDHVFLRLLVQRLGGANVRLSSLLGDRIEGVAGISGPLILK